MKDFYDFTPFQEALASAQNLAIVLPKRLNKDKVAAALSLFLSLQNSGKKVSIVCSLPMIVDFSSLVGVNKVKQKLVGKDLVVSFKLDDSIERVRSNIDESNKENRVLNLVVQTKEGYPPFPKERIVYSHTGSNTDVFLTLGAESKEDLGRIYFDNKDFFDKGNVINIDINSQNKQFGKLNLVNPQMSCYSEFVALLLDSLKLPLDEDIASNLLVGIKQGTNNFSLDRSTPTTFEAIAFCLRAGGRKPKEREVPFKEVKKVTEPKKEVSDLSKKPSPDWFKPKIYKGNTRI